MPNSERRALPRLLLLRNFRRTDTLLPPPFLLQKKTMGSLRLAVAEEQEASEEGTAEVNVEVSEAVSGVAIVDSVAVEIVDPVEVSDMCGMKIA